MVIRQIINWLKSLATQPREYLDSPRITPDLNAYRQFLKKVLLAIVDSSSDPQVVYPLLAANTDKLNENLSELLRLARVTNALAEEEADMAKSVAGAIGEFSNLIQQFPLGDKASNVEIAITGYEIILTVFTRTAFPQEWATLQINLGNAYSLRIKGDKADNLEKAITAYTAALEIYTRTTFPQEWVIIQLNLGSAYRNRIKEDKAENLEEAIASYIAALEVCTPTTFPQEWATTQNNLGNAYSLRIKGDKADNLEKAIAAYTEVLKVHTRIDFPPEWARMQNNLGNAYALRIKGDKAENLEQAIAAYTTALEVCTRIAFPPEWARIQLNLGNAYLYRIKGDKAENLEKAIAAYTEALQVYTRTAFPQDWAMTQNNLGNAYIDRIRGDKAQNLEQAITAFSAALQVYTRTAFPQDWPATQNNLGNAYRKRIRGDKAQNLKQAIAAYTEALQIYTRTAFASRYAEILYNLGMLYQDSNQFTLAESSFASAIETVEDLRDEIVSGEESKRRQAEQWNRLFRLMVEVCVVLGKETEAIEYVERSKNRNLVESILNRDSKTILPSEVANQLEELRDEIAIGQYQIQNGNAENPKALAQRLQELRKQRNKLQDKYLPVGSSFKFDQFQSTLDASTVIIEWYLLFNKLIAFVIKPQGQEITIWQSQSQDLDALTNWNDEYVNDYYEQKDQWQNQLEKRLKKLSKILHLEEILAQVPKHCERLILIPHRFLHLFPLHALPIKESYLLDLFPKGVGYAPSCQLLQQVQLRQRPDFQSLFAIQTPTEDLYEKDLGAVAAIKKQFSDPLYPPYILKQSKAKKSEVISLNATTNNVVQNKELLNANCAFFFCHGYFKQDSPLDSGLMLADCFVPSSLVNDDPKRYMALLENNDTAVDLTKCLILADIIAHLKLENCRLVTLSACETGMIDGTNISDEYIGLPSGFLLAGSTNVVSSLWEVDANATALFMVKFYKELQHQTNIVLALNTAQRWLRDSTIKEIRNWLNHSAFSRVWQLELDKYFAKIITDSDENVKPFASPYYWSAFFATGKGD